MGSMSKYIEHYALVYFLPPFLLETFPNHAKQIASTFSTTAVIAGITSCFAGGFIADKYGQKNPLNLSRILYLGSLLAWPAFLGGVLLTHNIWLTLLCVNLVFLFGECCWASNMTLMQRANPPEKFGSTVSVYAFFNYFSGSVSAAALGYLINTFGATFGAGKILAIVCSMAYATSIYSWK